MGVEVGIFEMAEADGDEGVVLRVEECPGTSR